MARRASSSAHPIWMLAAVLFVIAATAGGYFLYGRVSDPYRTMTTLPVHDYLENSNSLRGNAYKLDATIASLIEWSPSAGRLFSINVGENDVLAIVVPANFNQINIERGQRYLFKIEVGENGILRAQDVKKA
ncbi:MAG: hypothetical protein JWL59_4463 [Chthoniobacteraceae bacterium]|nr:hypothetical protein [Chthoniobacteraceae bacterium]